MDNAHIAAIFNEIADMLEIQGGDSFKIRAYRNGARSIEFAPGDITTLAREGKLREIPGIGKAISDKITELVTTGRMEYYERLRAELPPGVTSLLHVPGVGPKLALRLATELGIASLDDLERAIKAGQLETMPRVGKKTAESILNALETMRSKDRRIPIYEALPRAELLVAQLHATGLLRNLSIAGSLRRSRETIRDIDIIGTADDPAAVMRAFLGMPGIARVLGEGETKSSVLLTNGIQVDLRLVPHESWGSLLQHFTGSKEHNVALRELALRKGLSLSEYGITEVETRRQHTFLEEEAFYAFLGLQWVPPEIRENHGEIELAANGSLPRLVELRDLTGDFHMHTTASDGKHSLEQMVQAAIASSMQCIAITDHSQGLSIANGLTPERYREQAAELAEIRARYPQITVLHGSECDIRADGSLDLPDDLLAELDVVVGSVHSAMRQSQDEITARVVAAMRHPEVDIIGHPTARKILERDPIALDMDTMFRVALETNTVLEINSLPQRLDLKDSHIRRAIDLGVMLTIDSDSHSTGDQEAVRPYGVANARRGWCEPRHLLNTRPAAEMARFFAAPKAERRVIWDGWNGD